MEYSTSFYLDMTVAFRTHQHTYQGQLTICLERLVEDDMAFFCSVSALDIELNLRNYLNKIV